MKGSRIKAVVFVLFLVVVATVAQSRRIRERATPFGKVTAEEVLAQSEPLCRLLASPSANLQLTVARHADTGRPLWSVTCEDEKQGYVAEIIWDAESGEIARVGRNTSGFSSREKIALDGDSLIRLAEGWLRDLGIAPPGSVWCQIGKLEPVANSCIVRFISQGRFATLKLDIRSGSLITAEQWPRQSNHRSGVLE